MNQRAQLNTSDIAMPHRRTLRKRSVPTGNALVLLCIMLPVVLAISAFAINVVYMQLCRTELQIATDVATRAAGRTLAVTGNQRAATAAAERMLKLNPCGNATVPISTNEVDYGVSTRLTEAQRYAFTASKPNPNAVRLEGNGTYQVPMLFPTMGLPTEFQPVKAAICTQTEHDIAIVLDRSTSMAYAAEESSKSLRPAHAPLFWTIGQPAPPEARWRDATAAVREFLTFLNSTHQKERVSLATYSTLALQDVPLTLDYKQIHRALDLHTLLFLGGTTNIGDGIHQGTVSLSDKSHARAWATRIMIVMTDGIQNLGSDPVAAARYAASEHIMVFTVTFSEEADQEAMREVARVGHGKHYHARSGKELTAAFRDIAKRLPVLLTH